MCAQVPVGDNYYAALNSAVFSDGSFVYIPKGVKSAMELSTYFRINAKETGQVSSASSAIACIFKRLR
jgi:Fe-S cluster assembly protein SufB